MSRVVNAPAGGAYPEMVKVRVMNRAGAALSKGTVAILDILQSQAEVTTAVPGVEGSIFGNIRGVYTAGLDAHAPQVILLEDIADNAEGYVCLRGVVHALVGTSNTATDAAASTGEFVEPANAKSFFDLAGSFSVGHKVCALLLEDTSTFTVNGTSELRLVLFDGLFGHGLYAAS
jgi:hypothetical protein